jgi:hypothetical protein
VMALVNRTLPRAVVLDGGGEAGVIDCAEN